MAVRCLALYEKVAVICFLLPRSGTEPRVDNLAVSNVQFYPLSCRVAIVGIVALKPFVKTQQRNMHSVGIAPTNLCILFGTQTELQCC